MNVADSMRRLRSLAPGSPNGHARSRSEGGARLLAFAPSGVPVQALIVIAPLALAGTAVYLVQQRRTGAAMARTAAGVAAKASGVAAKATGVAAKARTRRRRPRNLLRYYGLALVISALERETTRKAVIAGLKWAQKRA